MTTETKRDLHADLALCESVRGVYYDEGGGYRADYPDDSQPHHYFEEADEGWPEAIRRAIAAEAEVERLDAKYQSMFSQALGVSRARDYYASAVHQAIYYLREDRAREALTVLTEVTADVD